MDSRLSMTVRRAALVCALVVLAMPAARAGLFDDDEARKAILDIRQRLDQNAEQIRLRSAEQLEQINVLKRTVFELNSQLEQMRIEMAKLRGQDEQLVRDVSELQRKQKDISQGVDERIRKIEPQKVSVDGKEFLADPEEKRIYDEALGVFRKSDYAGASAALSAFQRRYPASGYSDSVLFWLGNAQYALRDYKEAINSFRTMVRSAPDHARAPEALLSIANCQIELKDPKTARRTIDELMKTYPKSEAAQAGRERLASLR